MIRYMLICEHDHEFEAWFSSSKDYDDQANAGYVACPDCGTVKVEKAIMAPNVSTGRRKEKIASDQAKAMQMMNKAAETIRQKIADECDYVGDKFADEARAIHYGEKDERPIYGSATSEEVGSLKDEGIEAAPLPDILTPRPKQDVN